MYFVFGCICCRYSYITRACLIGVSDQIGVWVFSESRTPNGTVWNKMCVENVLLLLLLLLAAAAVWLMFSGARTRDQVVRNTTRCAPQPNTQNVAATFLSFPSLPSPIPLARSLAAHTRSLFLCASRVKLGSRRHQHQPTQPNHHVLCCVYSNEAHVTLAQATSQQQRAAAQQQQQAACFVFVSVRRRVSVRWRCERMCRDGLRIERAPEHVEHSKSLEIFELCVHASSLPQRNTTQHLSVHVAVLYKIHMICISHI